MKILIAEDEFLSREMLHIQLAKVGVCISAMNGQEAYDAFVRAYEEDDPYGLICLDVVMPQVDGIETLKKIRAYEESRGVFPGFQTRVIMTTAMDDAVNVIESFKSLCDGYLVKPVQLPKLQALLREFNLYWG